MHSRVLNIGKDLLLGAVKDKDKVLALALAVCIKVHYVSSQMNNFSIRKLMELVGASYATTKKALKCALAEGWVEYDMRKDGTVDLVALPLYTKGQKTFRIYCCQTKGYGPQVFLKSTTKDNEFKYTHSTRRQTLAQVAKVIQLCGLMNGIMRYTYRYYSEIKSRLDEPENKVFKRLFKNVRWGSAEWIEAVWTLIASRYRKKNFLSTGYSFQTMMESIFDSSISINQVRSLINLGRADGLFTEMRHSICTSITFMKERSEKNNLLKTAPKSTGEGIMALFEPGAKAYSEAMNKRIKHLAIERGGKFIRFAGEDKNHYKGKGDNANNEYARMANSYFCMCDLVGMKHQRYNKNGKGVSGCKKSKKTA